MMALFLQKSANTPNSLAKVQQKMHIRKQSEKFYKKIIDSIYLYGFHRTMGACS